ncbi:MAG: hypothetical protein AAGF26_02020 [Cyanobacteria bacterium P01_G01_bin.49]
MLKIAHIVNPVVVNESSDLFVAQPITFKTMLSAKTYAEAHNLDVDLFTAQFPEDHSIVPEGFQKTPDLNRSVLDFGDFEVQRKLPLIRDIIGKLFDEAQNADFLIYTNADIALMPYFYITVAKIIDKGYDAFVINRRTISKKYYSPEEIPLMYSQAGEKHGGYDCFVFRKSAYENYKLGSSCIGAPPIGKILLLNLIGNAKNFQEFADLHLTFHIGNDETWKSSSSEYNSHNLNELRKVYQEYQEKESFVEHPLIIEQIYNKLIADNSDQKKSFYNQHKQPTPTQPKTSYRLFDKIRERLKSFF